MGASELLAAGPGVLIRIRLTTGLITRTEVPALRSNGPVYFVVGPHQAILRPLDFVPGYLVPDDQPARLLPAALGRGGPAFPGPRSGQLWVETGFGTHLVMSLVDMSGRRIGASISLPRPWGIDAVADGRGYLLIQFPAAVYDIRPTRRWRVSSGTIDAVGPSAWLITRCSHGRCRYEVIDPASGSRRPLPGTAVRSFVPSGVISPNGRVAALAVLGHGQRFTLHLINLATGDRKALPVYLAGGASALAWAPDSRWLFAATMNGALLAIDPKTGRAHRLGVTLPPVSQLAIRTAS
jgi:hypothetical protein